MVDKVKMIAPRLTVLMDDGAIHEVQANNFDLVMQEREVQRKRLPSAQDSPLEWMTWLAWHSLQREGAVTKDTSYEDFLQRCASIDPTPVNEDPSPPVPETG